MGQKVRPTGFRVGIMTDWFSQWYPTPDKGSSKKKKFAELLYEDWQVRKFVRARYKDAQISRVRIQRTMEKVTVYIHAGKVGMIIGKKGEEVDRLTKDLEDLTNRRIEVKTMEVNRPELDPQLVAQDIAAQLEKRASFRRTMKRAIDTSMEGGAKGIKIQMAGRLGGSEMARVENAMAGSIPLSTLRARVEFGFTEAKTAQGHIGIKVWINNGDYLNPQEDSDAANAQASKVSKKPAGRRKG